MKKNPLIENAKQYIDQNSVKSFFDLVQSANYHCRAEDKESKIRVLAMLTVCRSYCSVGSSLRQEIDALHSKVWATLEASIC